MQRALPRTRPNRYERSKRYRSVQRGIAWPFGTWCETPAEDCRTGGHRRAVDQLEPACARKAETMSE
jgi:hypothetical protein